MHFTQTFITGKGSYISHTANAPCAFFAASVFLMNTNKRILLPRKNYYAIATDHRYSRTPKPSADINLGICKRKLHKYYIQTLHPSRAQTKNFRFDAIAPEFTKRLLFILTLLKKANHPTALSDHYLMASVPLLEALQQLHLYFQEGLQKKPSRLIRLVPKASGCFNSIATNSLVI